MGGENRVYTEYIKVPLDSGSLLIMDGAIQNDWQVSVNISVSVNLYGAS